MKHRKLIALLVTLIGTAAVLLSLASLEDTQYTGPRPTWEPTPAINVVLTPNRKPLPEKQALPAEAAPPVKPPGPEPTPMDREAYADGGLWIRIPALGVEAAVIDGTAVADLKKGPGLYEISPMPDEEDGNVCIAGHRTTYGAWFRQVDSLSEGDEIILYDDDRQFYYAVETVFVVDQYDWSVTEPTGYTALTLTACHPPGSARQRIVVRAKRMQR